MKNLRSVDVSASHGESGSLTTINPSSSHDSMTQEDPQHADTIISGGSCLLGGDFLHNNKAKHDVEEAAWSGNPDEGVSRLFGSQYTKPNSPIGVDLNAFAEGDGIGVSTLTGRVVYSDSQPGTSNHSKVDSNFRPLVAEKVYDGVNISSESGQEDLEGPDYVTETIRVEYEWKPPRFHTCNIFGHTRESCPKKVINTPVVNVANDNNDGFQKVVNKKRNNKGKFVKNPIPKGVPVSKGFQVGKEFAFKPKTHKDADRDRQGTGQSSFTKNADDAFVTKDKQRDNDVVDKVLESHVDVSNVFDTCRKVISRTDNKPLFCSFVYVDNYYVDRRALWYNLAGHSILMRDKPWALLGDFNTGLNLEDHSSGGYEPNIAMRSNGILKKIDRIMCNIPFNDSFLVVDIGWNININRYAMYRVVKHLKGLKTPLQKLLHDQAFKESSLDEERFLRQKANVEWLNASDYNTAYFHRMVKSKCMRNRIDMVRDYDNTLYEGNDVAVAFVSHYEQFLGVEATLSLLSTKIFSISKIIANRIKVDIGDLVSINQSAFVPGRRISDNILLTQELMRNYHRRKGLPRCAFKVDIQKDYDTVDWGFLKSNLIGFGFHPIMVDWIMTCVTSTSYSICINGNIHGWFQGSRGVSIHHHCEKQRIVNLCFADDLFLFTKGNLNSVQVIISALKEFKDVSGLVLSIPKSTAFFCNVPAAFKASILSSTPFAEGTLPVRYLGVLLISSRESLWVKWIHSYKLRAWFDRWADICPLKKNITNRDIVRAGFSIWSSVSSIISNDAWRWPHDWEVRFPELFHMQVLMIQSDREDVIMWRDIDGIFRPFSVACAWESIRLRADVVPWIEDVLAFIIPISKSKSVVSIISRIVLADTTYYLWNERSSRLLKKKIASVDQVVQVICHIVRLKLVSFKFKKVCARSRLMLDRWKVPSVCVTHDGSAGFAAGFRLTRLKPIIADQPPQMNPIDLSPLIKSGRKFRWVRLEDLADAMKL
nr:hypothetical protein [Tanacetum cinerariifolium]